MRGEMPMSKMRGADLSKAVYRPSVDAMMRGADLSSATLQTRQAGVEQPMSHHSPSPAVMDTKVHKVMHEFGAGTLKSGGGGKKVTSRKQAVAIALSEGRRAMAGRRKG